MCRSCVMLAVLIVGTACGRDATTQPAPRSFVGTWNLLTVEGTPLPFIMISNGNDQIELTSDVIAATSDGVYTEFARS